MVDATQSPDMTPATAALIILIPIYNDWEAVSMLLVRLDRVLAEAGLRPRVLLVDDGSTTAMTETIAAHSYKGIERIEVLALRRNLGHQRAIAIALAYLYEHTLPGAVLVMDGDGEDAPEDVPRLTARLAREGEGKVIFAERTRRSESLSFRVFYNLYRLAHVVLTGIPVRVGNFSIVPGSQLSRLVVVSELWNHYAAAIFKARLPRSTIPTVRAQRLSGRSRMDFVALVGHGLSALSVHAELIGVRFLALTALLVCGGCALLGAVLAVRLWTPLAIPGWATTAAGLLVVFLFEIIAFAVLFVFLVLHSRSQPLFIPIRDYSHFVNDIRTVFPEVTSADAVDAPSQVLRRS